MQTKIKILIGLILLLSILTSCSTQLKQDPAPPSFWPDGLWLKNGKELIGKQKATDHFELLRIICNGEQCLFRSIVLYYGQLPISGLVFTKTERSGYIETSANELLLRQTEFKNVRIEWPEDPNLLPKSIIERVVHGNQILRLFKIDSANQLSIESDGDVFDRQCNQNCRNPIALILPLPKLKKQLVISPDAEIIGNKNINWPADLQSDQRTELMCLVDSNNVRQSGAIEISLKSKVDFASLFESKISFTPGAKAIEIMKQQQTDKQQRIDDIKQRLKDGKPVSREEMLEILE